MEYLSSNEVGVEPIEKTKHCCLTCSRGRYFFATCPSQSCDLSEHNFCLNWLPYQLSSAAMYPGYGYDRLLEIYLIDREKREENNLEITNEYGEI